MWSGEGLLPLHIASEVRIVARSSAGMPERRRQIPLGAWSPDEEHQNTRPLGLPQSAHNGTSPILRSHSEDGANADGTPESKKDQHMPSGPSAPVTASRTGIPRVTQPTGTTSRRKHPLSSSSCQVFVTIHQSRAPHASAGPLQSSCSTSGVPVPRKSESCCTPAIRHSRRRMLRMRVSRSA